jgi:hypothetical protein
VKTVYYLLSLLAFSACTATADLIPAAQLIDWTPGVQTGVPGGIGQYLVGGSNARTNLVDVTAAPFNADNTGVNDSTSAINTAMNHLSPNGVLYLPAGTYRLDGQIYIPPGYNGFTIRGAGPTQTIINAGNNGIYFGASDGWIAPSPSPATVTGGLVKGSTSITVDDASQFTVGKIIRISFPDQTNSAAIQAGAVINFGVGGSDPNNGLRKQICMVTGIVGNTLNISPAIYRTPDAGLASAKVWTAILQNNYVGIEDMSFNMSKSNGIFAILMEHCYGCWVKNVYANNVANYAVDLEGCLQCEIRHCNFKDRQVGGSNGAGILLNTTSASLFEDNTISNIIPSFEVNSGASGNVFSYNLLENPPINGAIGYGADANHGPHNSFNLWEGNISPNLMSDGYYGSDSEDTVFRNWFHGTCYDNSVLTFTLSLKRFTRRYSVIGNILGKNGVNQGEFSYGQPNIGNASWSGTAQATAGNFWADWGATATLTTRASDTAGTIQLNKGSLFASQFTALQWNGGLSAQSFSVASVNGPVATWTGGGGTALPAQGSTVNVFTQSAGYQELDLDVQASTIDKGNYLYGPGGSAGSMSSVGNDTVPSSLAYNSKPGFFGSLAWPPVDSTSPNSISYGSIPAGYRFLNNGQDPSGSTSGTFGGSTATSGSSSSSAPQPPSNLHILQTK